MEIITTSSFDQSPKIAGIQWKVFSIDFDSLRETSELVVKFGK